MSGKWERVNELFNEALERPSRDRARFVTERSGDDRELREEVLSLIEAHNRAGSFLDSPAASGQPDEQMAEALPAGTVLGNYRIEREIGRGGMGIVYLAEDTRLCRRVALKALAPAFTSDEQRRERLRKEARAAARLSHPCIATVFALEEMDGHLFIACEYVAGRTLREEIDRALMPVARVLDVAVFIADALAAAHAEGVVHRDLKPENVICSDQGSIKILDFGVARSLPMPGEIEHRLTESGVIVGTPAYMSPEQLESSDVDFRSDVFSFGILLYEIATGVHPFEGSSHASTIARILTAEPRSPCELRQQLPPGFDSVVRGCLAKRPQARYRSTSELVRDLQRLKAGELPETASGSCEERYVSGVREAGVRPQARWWRVHQRSVVAVYAVMTAAAWLASRSLAADWITASLFAVVAGAALNGTLRVHLLFTERHNWPAFRGELRRSTPLLRASDAIVAVVLLVMAIPLARHHLPVAILFAAVAAGSIIVSVAVEPATTDAAFPRRPSGARRKTPAKGRGQKR